MRALVASLFGFVVVAAILGLSIARSAVLAAPPTDLDVVAHLSTPASKLSSVELEALFTRAQTRWGDGTAVIPLNAPTGNPMRDEVDRVVLRLSPDQVGRFWLDRRIRGLGLPPRQVPDATLMLKVIANLRGSIGYVRPELATPKVKIVARIRQGRVVPP